MRCTRRDFGSRLGLLLAGASGGNVWARAAGRAGAPPSAAGQDTQHLPVTTYAKGSVEGQRAGADQIWAHLLAGNQRFVAGKPLPRELVQRREELVAGQHPQAIVLACSDSRVSPTLIFDQNLGDLFVVRTAGNVADAVGLGSIEYAVAHLHIWLLVILGHEGCGAVEATASGEKMPTANLAAVVSKIAPAVAKVRGQAQGEEFLRKAVEANVYQGAADILANSPIVQREAAAKHLEIIKALYSLKTGQVTRLAG